MIYIHHPIPSVCHFSFSRRKCEIAYGKSKLNWERGYFSGFFPIKSSAPSEYYTTRSEIEVPEKRFSISKSSADEHRSQNLNFNRVERKKHSQENCGDFFRKCNLAARITVPTACHCEEVSKLTVSYASPFKTLQMYLSSPSSANASWRMKSKCNMI